MSYPSFSLAAAALSLFACSASASIATRPLDLRGTWTLLAAYEVHADGTRTTNYGEHPDGLLLVDAQGRYSLQLFRHGRAKFASGDKARGSADEYRDTLLGSSTHYGRVAVDAAAHRLVFSIEGSSYPNWENTQQVREYTYTDGVLTYAVPASASGSGTIAYSVWKRAQ